jgi:hypothetical protein
LFGSFLTPAPTPTLSPSPLASAWNLLPGTPIPLRVEISNNKKDIAFLLVEIRTAIQKDF